MYEIFEQLLQNLGIQLINSAKILVFPSQLLAHGKRKEI